MGAKTDLKCALGSFWHNFRALLRYFFEHFFQDAFPREKVKGDIVLFGAQASPGEPLAKAKGPRLRTVVLG